MSRCEHGFLQGVVTCPEGCHSVRTERRNASLVGVPEMVEALKLDENVYRAARRLGIAASVIYRRAEKHPELQAVMPPKKERGGTHPAFVDMTGQVKGPWTVLRRMQNDERGNAQWECRHECGAPQAILGTALRAGTPTCKACTKGSHGD